MPFESVLPATFPSWDIDVGWPPRQYDMTVAGVVATNLQQSYRRQRPRGVGNTTAYMVDVAGNSIVPHMGFQNGLPCLQFQPQPTIRQSVFFFCEGAAIAGPVDSQGFEVTEAWPSLVSVIPYQRVYIDDFMVAFSTANLAGLTILTSIARNIPDSGVVQTAVGGNVGTHYGLRCDGAGGVEFQSVIASVVQDVAPIAWPVADFRTWVKVTVEHQMATANGPGQVRYFLNDVAVLTRAWGPATVLPNLAGGGNFRHIRRYLGQGIAEPIDSMFATFFRSRIGRYTVDGTELS